jgi:hypothetical protein
VEGRGRVGVGLALQMDRSIRYYFWIDRPLLSSFMTPIDSSTQLNATHHPSAPWTQCTHLIRVPAAALRVREGNGALGVAAVARELALLAVQRVVRSGLGHVEDRVCVVVPALPFGICFFWGGGVGFWESQRRSSQPKRRVGRWTYTQASLFDSRQFTQPVIVSHPHIHQPINQSCRHATTYRQPVQGKAVQCEPVSRMTDTRCAGVPTYIKA